MGAKTDKFLLLMWKNFLTQWRHPKQTAVEILAPILFASLMVVLRSLVHPVEHSAAFYLPFDNHNINMSKLPPVIAWSPRNTILSQVMDETIAAINIKRNSSVVHRHVAYANKEALDSYLKNEFNMISTLAGIRFDDSLADATRLHDTMNVTFRFPAELRGKLFQTAFSGGNWKTGSLFPLYQIDGPRSVELNEGGNPSYFQEGFLMLQQELSLSLINRLKFESAGLFFNRSSAPIQMQRFPYPKYTEDMLLTALQVFVGLIFMLSFVYTCISTVKVITAEKEKQLKEAMKIMGLPNWLHWTAWFIKSVTFLLITLVIMVILLKAKWYPDTDYTIFTYSDPLVIFLFLLLFACATITFCFAISVFFSKANTAATIAGMAWFLSYFPYTYFQDSYQSMSLGQKLSASLCANTAMAYGFQITLMFEGIGEGIQWNNIWKTTAPDDDLKFGHLMIMLVVDTAIYLLITVYVEAVFPGDYGVPQPWYFLFTKSYWTGKPRNISSDNFSEKPIESEYYEKEPTNLEAGIKIKRLRKVFSNKKVAVRDLTLNMYKDQITVLLGHNGAGKTTTMSMLTGMFPPTSGTAIVGGHDIRTDMPGVRESLGLCPQHNILFDELTVKEHLYFYSRLKGIDKTKVDAEIEKYVTLLELVPKRDALSATLSGGMKRKLSVGVALCGDSSVVMFDEPTAGMDPSARRALWDLLQSQKKGRTVLLSTHFMDEADLLGDRIAIMAGGKLQCCGSSFFLKKKYGAGYHLIMDKTPQCNIDEVTVLLQKYIPSLKVASNIGSELTYVLNEEHAMIFEKMLSELELRSPELGVSSYGISLTTLEEVFMKVGADHGQEEENNAAETENMGLIPNGHQTTFEPTNDNLMHLDILQNINGNGDLQNYSSETKLDLELHLLTGWTLWYNQLMAMFMKRGLSILRSWLLFVIQVCIPVMFLSLTFVIVHSTGSSNPRNFKIQLNSYNYPVTVLTRHRDNHYWESYRDFLESNDRELINWGSRNLSIQMIKETEENATAVNSRYISGATFNQDNSIVAWFNNQPYHSAPLALQLVINSILHKEVTPKHNIQMFNYPLPYTLKSKFAKISHGSNMGFQIAFNIGFSMAFVSSFYIMFYIRERVSKAKHLQFVSGVGVVSFWVPSFICDLLTFIFTSLCVIFTVLAFQVDGFRTAAELGRIFSVLICFGFAMLPMMYVSSYLFDIPSTGYTRMTLINIFTGVAAFLIVQVLSTPDLELVHVADTLHWIFLIVPHYCLSSAIQNINLLYSKSELCKATIDFCITQQDFNISLPPKVCKLLVCLKSRDCCANTDYYDLETPGIGKNILFSCCVGVFLIGVLLLIEYRVFDNIHYLMQKKTPPPTPFTPDEDSDVLAEKQRIRSLTSNDITKCNLVMRDVTKYYKDFLAVNNLCLGINKYECFGLLGVNGAGKTTTFKMMTGDIPLSSGDAWVNGWSLKTDMKNIHQLIGYCPQFDALLDDITCRETLIIFGLLRGMTRQESRFMAEQLASEFDFRRHLDKKVKELSGGNKRKLSTALALIGDPLVVYLDEPTTGMDPATKRYLWNALCKVRNSGKCIVLTSHSMEECEALCTRIAIMVNGVFKCLGSTQRLKSKFSEGYTLTIKVGKISEDELQSAELEPIEKFVSENFLSAIVREKHQELITFYIADKSLPWSRMFGIMERGKSSLGIEDYSLGQCSLEQVFLTFTKHQRDI